MSAQSQRVAALSISLLVAAVGGTALADDGAITPPPAGSEATIKTVVDAATKALDTHINQEDSPIPPEAAACIAAVDAATATLPPTTEIHIIDSSGRRPGNFPASIKEVQTKTWDYYLMSLDMVKQDICLPAQGYIWKLDQLASRVAGMLDNLEHPDGHGKVQYLSSEGDVTNGMRDAKKCEQLVDDAEKAGQKPDFLMPDVSTAGSSAKQPLTLEDVKTKICKATQTALDAFNAKRMESMAWPKDAKFGNAAALKAATLAWWKKHNQDGPPASRVAGAQVLAVTVKESWVVGSKDDFGHTTRWDLPVWVAVTNDELRKAGYAMVYDCEMVTAERGGVKAALPFSSAVIGIPFKFPIAKVPTK